MCVVELDRQKVISLCFPALVTDETRTNANLEAEMHLTCDPRTLELFLSEKEQKTSSENVAEQEMTKEEQKRQMEIDFQNELKEIMEAEKVSHSTIPSVGLLRVNNEATRLAGCSNHCRNSRFNPMECF